MAAIKVAHQHLQEQLYPLSCLSILSSMSLVKLLYSLSELNNNKFKFITSVKRPPSKTKNRVSKSFFLKSLTQLFGKKLKIKVFAILLTTMFLMSVYGTFFSIYYLG
jgi:hypothetical protein